MVSGDRREIQNSRDTFGWFLEKKRKEKDISMRRLAMKLGISATYLFEVEKGRKPPFSLERIHLASRILLLNKEEETWLLDLAGRAKKSAIAPDLP